MTDGAAVELVAARGATAQPGFRLGGASREPAAHRPMGRLPSRQAFGHNGSNCCIAWADPEHRLVFVYLTDRLTRGDEGARHLGAVSDAIIAAYS